MKKQLLLFLLALLPMMANADDSGSCGENVFYTFEEASGTLTISGTGAMYNYSHDPSSSQCSPWYTYRSKIETVSIEPGVTTIGTSAFYHSINIKTVIIPNSIQKIYNYAFSNCSTLESLDLPPFLSFIAQEAFSNCTTLSSVSIQRVEMIYLDAFKNCNNIQYVNINSIKDWCNIFFQGKNANPLYFAGHLYLNGEEVKELIIPDGISSVNNCTFYNCVGLTSVSIPEGVTTINQSAFSGCTNLSTITIPNSVTTIWNNAFERCVGLTKIYLGSNIQEIQSYCFQSCTSLKDFYCYAMDVPQTGNSIFYNTPYYNAILHVPAEVINKYKQKEPWKNFKQTVDADVQMYSLNFIIDGNEYLTYSIIEGEAILAKPTPTKEGYTFSGWSEIPEVMPAHDVTVTGSFTVNKYKLTYTVDGVEYKSYDIDFGSVITPEEAPTREGYTFSGWSEIPEVMPAHDVTVTGTFTINKYKLVYKVDGEVYKSYDVEYGTSIIPEPEPEPTQEYYTFSGWSEIPATMPAHDVTVTGTFNINKYRLIYKVDGEVYRSYDIEYGATITPEPTPTKEGYTFSGWSEIPATMPAHDVTVSGTFFINNYKVTFMVEGNVIATQQLVYGATIVPPTTDSNGNAIIWNTHPTTMPAYDITIYGTYATGIAGINTNDDECKYYTLGGWHLAQPQKGVNIIKIRDGRVRKIVVK